MSPMQPRQPVVRLCRSSHDIAPRFHWRRGMSGFTVIELLVTLVIVGILASAAFPMTELVVQRAKEQDLRQSLRDIRQGIDAYKQAVGEGRVAKKVDESGYPHTLDELVMGVPNAKDPNGGKLYFLRTIPRDPFYVGTATVTSATWGKRSYASSHEEPKEGKDVFDVYSLSEGAGLNGLAYREW